MTWCRINPAFFCFHSLGKTSRYFRTTITSLQDPQCNHGKMSPTSPPFRNKQFQVQRRRRLRVGSETSLDVARPLKVHAPNGPTLPAGFRKTPNDRTPEKKKVNVTSSHCTVKNRTTPPERGNLCPPSQKKSTPAWGKIGFLQRRVGKWIWKSTV